MKSRLEKAEERRGKILAAARQLFTRHGFHGTGVAQIASESGVKVGQLYRDFACKEDIIAALVEPDVGVFLDEQALALAVEAQDFHLVRTWIRRFIEDDSTLDDDFALMAETIAEATRNLRVAAIVHRVDARVRGSILTALAVLAPGETKAPQRLHLADFIMAIGHGVWFRRISDPNVDHVGLSGYVGGLIDSELQRIIVSPA
ncbi:TetR/AcrR family transcriptional regulator [Sphingomonas sp. PAMC 26617]|uniref:TetR/AcrR family transcriptional regulator n=1 Tax=Sphingomonas sp. PAMC 26617 TaxID=1112216 RepID=UPI0004977DCC|nr:TetR/AcrR family transcriptional regulator [Sphingomonas sp. PAMC 26617]